MNSSHDLSEDLNSESAREAGYNKVLEYYIEDFGSGELDLVGILAYGLYKRQKRDWIVQYKTLNAGRKPSTQEVYAVTSSYLTEDLKNTLRNRASDILSGYADTYVQAIDPQIRIDALNSEALRQARDIETAIKNQSTFWSQVWVGIVSTAIWTLFITAIALTVAFFGSDILDAIKSIRDTVSSNQ
ncbi:hypothetical protein [Allorhizobium undicola]|uniref:hypothetical protein n=1 Tax=Allorhizobium undicola TaxID=78527 RepID=UPI0006849A8B|nr:hypothetical protein [Allorhizobium undicola]